MISICPGKKIFLRFFPRLQPLQTPLLRKNGLDLLKKQFEEYQSLVDEEIKLIRANRDYPKRRYESEKEKRVDAILKELEKLELHSQQDIAQRIEMLGEAGSSARQMAVGMAITAIVLGLFTSFFITRAITRPLKVLVDKTRDISNGVFECQLNISSPPEVSELAKALNMMCEKLRALDKMKIRLFRLHVP